MSDRTRLPKKKLPPAPINRDEDGRKYPIGFDYQSTVLRLNKAGFTYEQIAEYMGYSPTSKSLVARIASGKAEPRHSAGESLYVMYFLEFKSKPPSRSNRRPKKNSLK
jgi:hypothetical protein